MNQKQSNTEKHKNISSQYTSSEKKENRNIFLTHSNFFPQSPLVQNLSCQQLHYKLIEDNTLTDEELSSYLCNNNDYLYNFLQLNNNFDIHISDDHDSHLERNYEKDEKKIINNMLLNPRLDQFIQSSSMLPDQLYKNPSTAHSNHHNKPSFLEQDHSNITTNNGNLFDFSPFNQFSSSNKSRIFHQKFQPQHNAIQQQPFSISKNGFFFYNDLDHFNQVQTPSNLSETSTSSNSLNQSNFASNSEQPTTKNDSRNTSLPPLSKRSYHGNRMRFYPSRAFKFFMEQHTEKVIKYKQDREGRTMQLEREMAELGLTDDQKEQMRQLLLQKESQHLRLRRIKMDKRAFEKVATLGGGAFGSVFLVKKKDSGMLYAMKRMLKKDVINKKHIAHVKAERDILAEADNRWVVKLYFSFQDEYYLYLVMDFIQGGDLMGLLMKEGIFSHELAQFYIAELVVAIDSVHKLGFIHRDIKPDNILIDSSGHIKLTDFGLCTGFHWTHDSDYYKLDKNNKREKKDLNKRLLYSQGNFSEFKRRIARSLVGTPNYIAPEVLLMEGYTSSCDWWSVGVILYEMRFGQPPFRADSSFETQKKVINWRKTLRYPITSPPVSSETINLISRLCCDAKARLGAGQEGIEEIKRHPFFRGIPFDNLHSIKPPFVPQFEGPEDISYFDAASLETNKRFLTSGDDDLRGRRTSSISPPLFMHSKNNQVFLRRSGSQEPSSSKKGFVIDERQRSREEDYFDGGDGLVDFTFRRFFDNE